MKEKNTAVWIFVGVFGLWGACLAFTILYFPTWAERGQFGDLFGAVNALFSGLAFAGLIFTIHLQRRELALQREELRLQREEMAKSREELANQVAVQRNQLDVAIARLKVSSLEAELEAQKMEAEQFTPGGRGNHVKAIKGISEQIASLASSLEKNVHG